MPQAAQSCSYAGGPCDAMTTCCYTSLTSSCTNISCIDGTCQYSPGGCCVPVGGACSNTAQCCPGSQAGQSLICAANVCSNILHDAAQDLFAFGFSAYYVIGPAAFTLFKLGCNLLTHYGFNVGTSNIIPADLTTLGNIPIVNLIYALNNTASFLKFPFPGATRHTLPVADLTRYVNTLPVTDLTGYVNTLIPVVDTQPSTILGDILGFETGDIDTLAGITVSGYVKTVANFITKLGNLDHVVCADFITILNYAGLSDLKIQDFWSFNMNVNLRLDDITNIGNILDGGLNNAFNSLGDNLVNVFNSLSKNNICNTNTDCCHGGTCSCCIPLAASGFSVCCGPVANAVAGLGALFGITINTNNLCSKLCPNFTTTTNTATVTAAGTTAATTAGTAAATTAGTTAATTAGTTAATTAGTTATTTVSIITTTTATCVLNGQSCVRGNDCCSGSCCTLVLGNLVCVNLLNTCILGGCHCSSNG